MKLEVVLTQNQNRIISLIAKNPRITARELAEEVGISKRKIEDNISKLKKMGVVRRAGPAKGGYWELIEE